MPSIVAAVGWLAAIVVWLVAGDALPGGRALTVHLFTLGVLTNLVLTFAEHFARTLTRTPGERAWWWPVVTNLAVLAVLGGVQTGQRALLVSGAATLVVVVLSAALRLRRMRRAAVGARFLWIVRVYEWAHVAFLTGAVLGALLGAGVLVGAWYGAARVAHLHANLLGWGGLTLLATLVFLGPTMARTRIEPGADATAARALTLGAGGLATATVALVLAGAGPWWSAVMHTVAGAGLAVLALATTLVCLPVMRSVLRGAPTAARPLLVGVSVWLTLVVWADAVVVATRAWWLLDPLGIVLLAGVLAQAILATLLYLAPMLLAASAPARDVVRHRLDRGAWTRAVVVSAGVLCLALGAARVAPALPWFALGWTLLLLPVGTSLVVAVWPVPSARAARG